MAYISETKSLLKRIDSSLQQIEDLVKRNAQRDAETATWSSTFSCAWAEVVSQLGWPNRRSRKRRLISKTKHILGIQPRKVELSFRSPIFDASSPLSMPFHPSYSKIPTEYGFKICATGRDMWHPLATGHYVTELSESLITLMLAEHSDCFVDIGANIGFFSFLFAAEAGRNANVIACEPSAENLKLITAGIEENGFNNIIYLLPVAVGSKDGTATLHLNQLGSGGNTMVPVDDESYKKIMGGTSAYFPRSEVVQVTTLDEIYRSRVRDASYPFVKIDVEGFERNVIEGGRAMLSSPNPPIIIYEAWPNSPLSPKGGNHRAIAEMLEEVGFSIWQIQPAIDGEPLISTARRGGRFRDSSTGNYLAVPKAHRGAEEKFLAPIDIRIFTGLGRLAAACRFVESCLSALQNHLRRP